MTFAEFRATGRDVPDLGAFEHIACSGVESGPGRVYLDDYLFIETLALDGAPTEYQLTIGNESIISADLAKLERKLYAFAVSEGYLDGEVQP